jgi:two-component system sensor histidine kinase KdpD
MTRSLPAIAVTAALLVMATVLVAVLQGVVGVPNPSAAYLLAVLVSAASFGTWAGIGASLGAFLLYDFLFIEPRYTLTVSEPGEWLHLILLLVVGVAVGQLAAALRSRAETAITREREARALFEMSRVLATRRSAVDSCQPIASILQRETRMQRIWIGLSSAGARERNVGDSEPGSDRSLPRASGTQLVLRRQPGDAPPRWVRLHRSAGATSTGLVPCQVTIQAGTEPLGSIWGLRDRRLGEPSAAETRLLTATADQLGQALEHDRLADESRAAEIALRSDALKSALLESVSHDLRTPLATIRAAAGTLMDERISVQRRDLAATAEAIDREAEHLNRVVTNLLDLSRIEAGELRPEVEPMELRDIVDQVLARLRPRLAGRRVEIDIPSDAPLVNADAVYLDQVIGNLLENAAKYVPPGKRIHICARSSGPTLLLTVEDSGQGAPDEALPRLFDKFYRAPSSRSAGRPGTGIGLAVVRGLAEAMGGSVQARRSALGGLAIDVSLPVANAVRDAISA